MREKKASFCLIIIALFIAIFLIGDVKAGITCQQKCDNCANFGNCFSGLHCLDTGCLCECNTNGHNGNGGLYCKGHNCSIENYRWCNGNLIVFINKDFCVSYSPGWAGCTGYQQSTGFDCSTIGKICQNGYCIDPAQQCNLNSVSILPSCGGNQCSQGENITINISYSGSSCPATSYIQVDAKDENGECIIEKVGGSIQGMNITCTSSPCIKNWTIPSIPDVCEGKTMYAYAAGLYNDSQLGPGNYIAGKQASIPPGFPQNWTFMAEVPVPGCYIASSCGSDKPVFSVSNFSNARGSIYSDSPTDYKRVCCPSANISHGEPVVGAGNTPNNQHVLRFSNITNAHVQRNDKTTYPNAVKIKKIDGSYATCSYQDIECPAATYPTCIVSISGDDNAHVANCSGSGSYSKKVCCNLSVGVPPTDCSITSKNIVAHCGPNGCETGENITLNASYTGTCPNINEIKMYAYNNTNNVALLMNASCVGTAGTATCTGNWTVNQQVYNLLKGLTMTVNYTWLYNNTGIVAEKPGFVGSFNFAGVPTQLPCNVIDANITTFCGDDGVCNATIDKIQLNITVENVANCLNVNKIEIDASSSTGGHQPPVGGGACSVTMTSMTPIQTQGNRFIANWTVSISTNCVGKTVYATMAKVYNSTNIKIGEKSGDFGSFRFANKVGECYCIYNNNQYSCGSCIEGTRYYCKNADGIGQIVSNCNLCNNCPSGTICSVQSGECIGQPGPCHSPTANSSVEECHAVVASLCFWDKPRMLNTSYCEACFAVNGIPIRCSDYKNKSACVYNSYNSYRIDRCGIGPYAYCDPGHSCWCEWDNGECKQIMYNDNTGEECSLVIRYGECDDPSCGAGKRNVTYDYENVTSNNCYKTDTSYCQPCGLLFRPLPFFEWWQILCVVGLVIIIYTFMFRRKSKF